jgi:hypothetical protein
MLVSTSWKKPNVPDFEVGEYLSKNIFNFGIDEY